MTTKSISLKFRIALMATILFVTFAVMYFAGVGFPMMMAWPLAVLFLFGLGILPWQMCLAMLFSCCGDVMGVLDMFLPQMGFFALAHVSMICFFVPLVRKTFGSLARLHVYVMSLVLFAVLLFAFLKILPSVESAVVRIGASTYSILIACMAWSASMQVSRKDIWSCLVPVGALLFLGSDMILAWNAFVSPVAEEKYLIMVPYYLGQISLFWGTAFRIRES